MPGKEWQEPDKAPNELFHPLYTLTRGVVLSTRPPEPRATDWASSVGTNVASLHTQPWNPLLTTRGIPSLHRSLSEILSVVSRAFHCNGCLCSRVPLPPPWPGRPSPGVKALLAMVVGEWRLPAAGQGRVCAGTLGLLLDPGGGAVESYCGAEGGQSRQSVSEEAVRASSTSCSPRTGWGTGTAWSLLWVSISV